MHCQPRASRAVCVPESLKRQSLRTDTHSMFSPRERPLLLVAERLFSLRLSLNTPVVATDELPAGPARAALAIHSEAGRTRFTVAVRSLPKGVSVLYELEGEDVSQPDGFAVALDASLSFGESMGFLFDDEIITDREPTTLRRAVARLREIVSFPRLDVGDPPASELAGVEDDREILLEEAVEHVVAEPSPGSAAAAAAPGAAPTLTKFRDGGSRAGLSAPAPAVLPVASGRTGSSPRSDPIATAAGGARLGRVQPLRVRAPGAVPPVPLLLRLLAAF